MTNKANAVSVPATILLAVKITPMPLNITIIVHTVVMVFTLGFDSELWVALLRQRE